MLVPPWYSRAMGPHRQGDGMAGSGPGALPPLSPVELGGWNSGAGTYTRQHQRRDEFLAAHPEWTIEHVRDVNRWEASMGSPETRFELMHERSLELLMDRLEDLYEA